MKANSLDFRGEQLTIPEISKRTKVSGQLIRDRMARGMSLELAVTAPKLSATEASKRSRKKSPWGKGPMVSKGRRS